MKDPDDVPRRVNDGGVGRGRRGGVVELLLLVLLILMLLMLLLLFQTSTNANAVPQHVPLHKPLLVPAVVGELHRGEHEVESGLCVWRQAREQEPRRGSSGQDASQGVVLRIC